jgi:Ca2+-binding RTX toxin-like protein
MAKGTKGKLLNFEEDSELAGLSTLNSIVGTPRGDILLGTSGDDHIQGLGGNDIILGAGGNDILAGGKGLDLISGGAGQDTADYSGAAAGVTVNLALGLALKDGDGGMDVLASIENVTGSASKDSITGNNQANQLTGGAGDDALAGGKGADTYFHSGTKADGDDTVNAGDNGVDRVIFSTPDLYDLRYERHGNDLVIGTYLAGDSFQDGPFDGSLRIVNHYAGAAIDTVEIDTSFYNTTYGTDPEVARFHFTTDLANGLDNTEDTEVLLGSDTGETINANGGYYDMIFANGGDDVVHGGDGFDNIRGGTGNDQIFGDGGNDALRGQEGDDLIDGGDDFDIVHYNLAAGAVEVDLLAGYAKDRDASGNTGTDTIANVESVRGSNFDDVILGDDSDVNSLNGIGGDDVIDGRGGFDDISGGLGNDTLLGGDGDDFVNGGDGDDLLSADAGGGFLIGGSGVDTFQQSVLNHPIDLGDGVFLNDSTNIEDFNFDEDVLRFTDLVDFGGDGLDLSDLNAQIDSFYFDADFGVAGIIFTSGSGLFFNNQAAAISSVEDLVSNAATQIQLA